MHSTWWRRRRKSAATKYFCHILAIATACSLSWQAVNAHGRNDRSAAPIREKWALLIGVDRFQDTSIPAQKAASHNVELIGDALTDLRAGKFAHDHVMRLTGKAATKYGIEQAVKDWLAKKALPDDLMLIYLSTPAVADKNGDPLAMTYDTLASEVHLSALDLKEVLTDLRKRTQSKNIVCILDTSKLGKMPAPDFRVLATTGITYISAADKDQTSLLDSPRNLSLFAERLEQALRTDTGNLPLRAVFEQLSRSVPELAEATFHQHQNPTISYAPENPAVSSLALGTIVKSSLPSPSFNMGHPLDRLALDRPDLTEPLIGGPRTRTIVPVAHIQTDAKAAEPRKPMPKSDNDDDDDDAPKKHVDYGPYITKMKQDIQKHWHPPKKLESRRITATFTIMRDGQITDPVIIEGSGMPELDKSALDALQEASPLDPLPDGAPKSVDMKYKFEWKVEPK